VTASPYHPQGRTAGVPGWRLLLSRGASLLHRLVAGGELHTYTSCFRVYRRRAVAGMQLAHLDFLGIAEMLHKLAASGGKIVEFPAVLGARTRGVSKVKLTKTIAGHLMLLGRLLRLRLAGRPDLI
jgi:dolichol-phosphate mannosyltransferase